MYHLTALSLLAITVGQIYAAPAIVVTKTITGTNSHRTWTSTQTRTKARTKTKIVSPNAGAPTCSAAANGTAVSLSPSAPSNAPIPPADFIGFGFETAFINDYANTFSENLINNIANRAGAPLIIRVGGTSGDRVQFDPNQSADKLCISGDCPIGSGATYVLGPSYFNGFKSFQNQHFSFQAPMGRTVNTTGSLDYVTRAWDATGASRVAAIALGNEVDIYGSGYTVQQYVTAALALEGKITDALGISSNERIFEVLDIAGPAGAFSVQNAFQAGIDKNGAVKYAAQHWYQHGSTTSYTPADEQQDILSHNAIVSKFNSGYSAGLAYIAANDPSVSWIISESGTSLIGPPLEYQDAFGGALWVVDFELYAMSQGVKRVDQTGRPAAPHSLWVPNTSANNPSNGIEQNIGPQVRGPYYGLPLVADFLGSTPGPVTEILSDDLATAYATYDASSGKVTRVALVNLKFWAKAVGGTRGSTTFDIPVSDPSVTEVKVQRLQAEAGAYAISYDNQGQDGMITYAGKTWSYQLDGGAGSTVAGVPAQETVSMCDGVVSVTVRDSEAALVLFG